MNTKNRLAMNPYGYTRLGRVLSWKYPSHRFAFIGSAATGAVGFFLDSLAGEWNFLGALLTGVAVFLAWACARELDPDQNATAFLSLLLAAPLAIWDRPALLLVVVALQGLRLMAGTVGGTLQPADYGAILLGAMLAGSRSEGWGILLLLLAAVLLAQPKKYLLLAVGVLGAGTLSAAVFDASVPDRIGSDGMWTWSLLALVALVVSLRIEAVASKTDVGKEPLSVARVRAARFFAGLAVAGGLLATGSTDPTVLGPLFAAMVATAVGAVLPINRAPSRRAGLEEGVTGGLKG